MTSYTRGRGRIFCTPAGYEPCHNAEEVTAFIGYDAERDTENPAGSVFCAHGAGFNVPWEQVEDYMHIEPQLEKYLAMKEAENNKKNGSMSEEISRKQAEL